MGWKNTKQFDPNKMGTRKGWCEMNMRLGFGINIGHFASAKADCEYQRAHGTLHPMSEYSNDTAVPVYIRTNGPYWHVVVDDHGTIWSDGKRLSSLQGLDVQGWGECADNQRVVEWSSDPTPPSPTGFLPEKGYWCRYNKDSRVAQLASFMRKVFPAYTPASALGPTYGDNLWRSIMQFQKNAKADGHYNAPGSTIDGNTGPLTYEALKYYGFTG